MVRLTHALLSVAVVAAVSACSNETTSPVSSADLAVRNSQSSTGNGAQSGPHYTLNIIGMEKGKNADMQATGSAMFVGLDRTGANVTTKIMLTESTDGTFAITDKDGTDGVAGYTLPAPVIGENTQAYAVYARALGTPGGQATITTCAEGYVDSTSAQIADEVCSTEKMVTYCKESPAKEIIIVTEAGMLHRLRKEIPDKLFIAGPTDRCACAECRFMKMNTLEKAHAALLNLEPEIVLPEPVRQRAELPIRRMLELSR